MTGKTSLFLKLIENPSLFSVKPAKIVFMYNNFQDSYIETQQKLAKLNIQAEFFKGSELTEEDLERLEVPDGHIIIAIDDGTLTTTGSKSIVHLMTTCRHRRCSIWLFWHGLYFKTAESRIISNNVQAYIIMAADRLTPQVRTLGTQMGVQKALTNTYKIIKGKLYGYLFLDLNPTTPTELRIRTNILDKHPTVFVPKG